MCGERLQMLPGSFRTNVRGSCRGAARYAATPRVAFDAALLLHPRFDDEDLTRQVERGDQRSHELVAVAVVKISSGDGLPADLIEQHCQLISMTGQHRSTLRFIGGGLRCPGPAGSEHVKVCHSG